MTKKFEGHKEMINSTAFHPNGRIIASCSQDRTIRLWDIKPTTMHKKYVTHQENVNSVFFNQRGNMLLTVSEDAKVILWEKETCKPKYTYIISGEAIYPELYYAQFIEEDDIIVLVQQNYVKVINMVSSIITKEIDMKHTILNLSYCKKTQKIAITTTEKNNIEIWNVRTGTKIKTIRRDESSYYIRCIAFSNKGDLLASGSEDETIKICGVSGIGYKTLLGHQGTILCLCFSPDDSLLASGAEDATIKIWETKTGKLIRTLEGHSHEIKSVSFNHKGDLVVSGSFDGYVKVWDVATGKLLVSYIDFEDEKAGVNMVQFSPNGDEIAAVYYYGMLRVWDFPSLQEVIDRERERFKDRSLSEEDKEKYYIS